MLACEDLDALCCNMRYALCSYVKPKKLLVSRYLVIPVYILLLQGDEFVQTSFLPQSHESYAVGLELKLLVMSRKPDRSKERGKTSPLSFIFSLSVIM